jgi:hypothetical protein
MTTQKIINQKYNLTNQPFGKLTAIELFHKPTTFGGGHGRYWKCKCSCGGEKVVSYHSLVGGMTKSCGCEWQRTLGYRGNHPISEHYLFTGCGEMPGTYYSGVKRTSRERKIDFSVSKEYLWDLFVKQNRKCALSGLDLQFRRDQHSTEGTASLDRIDSFKGYVEGNVQWLHKDINFMKQTKTDEYFIQLCKLVAETRK